MKSQCWGRVAKPCLSECSGCCGLLKCQVLLKNNTPTLSSFSLTLLPLAPCLPSILPHLSKPESSQCWSRGWGMNPWLGFASGANCSVWAALTIFYLFIYFFPHVSPVATEVETARVLKWNHFSLSLFSLSSRRHTYSLDSFHFIPCLSWRFPWCGAWSYRPKISQAPSTPSVQ